MTDITKIEIGKSYPLGEIMAAYGTDIKSVLGSTDLAPECLTQSAKLIARRGDCDVYEMEEGDYYVECSSGAGSAHLVLEDEAENPWSEMECIVGACLLTDNDLDVIFDNGGGIKVQTRGYVHHYLEPIQAAQDVKGILAPDYDPSGWDGDEPCFYEIYTGETERNGGYHWISKPDLLAEIASTNPIEPHGYAETEFLRALTGRPVEDEDE